MFYFLCPPSSLFRCVMWTSIYLFIENVVDNQSKAGSSPCRHSEPCRLTDKLLVMYVFFNSFYKNIFWSFFCLFILMHLLEVCSFMFVAAQVYTHTHTHTSQLHFSTTLKPQTPRAFDPSALIKKCFQGEDANLEEMMLWLTNL